MAILGAAETRADPRRGGFAAGALGAVPILPAVIPFGLIFGTLAAETGLDLVQAVAMAALVVAAASQLAALQLLGDGAPLAVIVFTGAMVNLRLAMYSASLVPHLQGVPLASRALAAMFLHDQAYAVSIAHYRARPDEPPARRIAYFLGAAVPTSAAWVLASAVGMLVGDALPEGWNIDFFLPIAFLATAAPMVRGRPALAAAAVAVAAAVVFRDLPFRSGLFVASALGIAVGMAFSRGGADGAADGPGDGAGTGR